VTGTYIISRKSVYNRYGLAISYILPSARYTANDGIYISGIIDR